MSVSSFKPPKGVNKEGDDDGSRSEGGTPRVGADLPIDELDDDTVSENNADNADHKDVLDNKHNDDKENNENKPKQDTSENILEKDKDDSLNLSENDKEGDDDGSRSEGGTPRVGADPPVDELDDDTVSENYADNADQKDVLDNKHNDDKENN